MCIISNKIESVNKTKILVALDALKTRQLTVYTNTVHNTVHNNAMLLPVPNPQTVKFHNLSNYKNIFADCGKCFYTNISRSITLSNSNSKSARRKNILEVFNVGSYKVSLAMNVNELKNIDKSVFELSDACYNMMVNEYSDPVFGIIICKLNTGKEDYHPMGYSHKLLNNKMFIPTKHFHEHNSQNFKSLFSWNKQENFASLFSPNNLENFASLFSPNNSQNITDDWEHEIYLFNGTNKENQEFIKMSKNNSFWAFGNLLQTKLIDFDFSKLVHFEKHVINGKQNNIDLIASIDLCSNAVESPYKYYSNIPVF